MLSFFTAVVAPTLSPGSSKSHPSLDEIGNAEEKRRRRLKKQKLRERRERHRLEMLASNVNATPNSSAAPQSSPEADGMSAFETPPSRTGDAPRASVLDSARSSRHVGLGLNLEDSEEHDSPAPSTPPGTLRSALSRRRSRGRTVSFDTTSPAEPLSAQMRSRASLEELSRRAWVSPRGTLRLLKSPVDPEGVFPGTPIDPDDSGVFFNDDEKEAPAQMPKDGWGARHRRESSSGSALADSLDAKMSRLSFLDQVMANKTSPRRLYKEAKEREKAEAERKTAAEREKAEQAAQQIAQLATQAELREAEAMRAAETANAIKANNSDYALDSISTPLGGNRSGSKLSDAVVKSTPVTSSSKSVRWITGMQSPRNHLHSRMTTREHYDLMMHGISPGQPEFDGLESICNINNTPGPITFSASWDAEPLSSLRKTAELRSSASKGLVFGSPTQAGVFGDESRPELIGVSPSVAGFFHARQGSNPGSSQAKLFRSISDGYAVLSPLSGRLVPSVQSKMGELDFDEEIQTAGDGLDSLDTSERAPTFNAKRGLLFATPTSSPGPSKAHMVVARSPSQSTAPFTRFDMNDAGPMMAFSSPRSALLRADSTGALDLLSARRERHKSGLISPRHMSLGSSGLNHHRQTSKSWPKLGHTVASDTISPADVFGSAVTRPQGANTSRGQPLPEPTKMGTGHIDVFSDDEIMDAEYSSDVELSARKKMTVRRRARSHSPQSPLKALEAPGQESGLQLPAIRLEYGSSETGVPGAIELVPGMDNTGAINPHSLVGVPAAASALAPATTAGNVSKKANKGKSSSKSEKRKEESAKTGNPKVKDVQAVNFEQMAAQVPSVQSGDEVGWDQPDGSRLVKLVSEELQAALESGTLEEEPPARYYLLPPGFGQSKAKPSSVSYAGLIGQAIKSSSDMRLSLAEIYAWISTTYPFFERGDRGWQNSIRHNLSLNKSFIKIEREANMPGKGGWWGIKSGHEERFQNGLYNAAAQKLDNVKKQQAVPAADSALSSSIAPNTSQSSASGGAVSVEDATAKGKKAAKIRRKKVSTVGRSAGLSSDEDDNDRAGQVPHRPVKKAKMDASSKVVKATRLPLQDVQAWSQVGFDHSASVDMITPVRPQGSSVYASSVAGSQHSRGLPTLTDSASSPPSSPLTLMPPPTMQLTSDHSVLKRKLGSQNEIQLGYGPGFAPSPFGAQGSPYRSMRGPNLGGAFNFSHATQHDVSSGSPLRRQTRPFGDGDNLLAGSPKRLWSMSSPVSSLRGSAKPSRNGPTGTGNSYENSTLTVNSAESLAKSPNSAARIAALAHSPIRSSPLRHASSTFGGSPTRSTSAAGLHMQMAMGAGHGAFGQMQGFGAGLGMGSGATPGRTPGSMRFTSSSSPMRRSLLRSGNSGQMQMMNGSALHQGGSAAAGWYLDDPFDVQSNLQQELDFSQMGGVGNVMSGVGSGGAVTADGSGASPLRMMWNTIQAAGGIQAFTQNHHMHQHHQP